MSWDLFTSAAAEDAPEPRPDRAKNRAEPPLQRMAKSPAGTRGRSGGGVPANFARADLIAPNGIDNEALARQVAAAQADGGFAAPATRAEWSVSDVNAAARSVLEGVLPPVWVVGEVANFTRARSGHCYFSLRDDSSQLRCVMWREEARRLPTTPAEGMKVRVLGRLTIYEGRGEFQLVVSDLEGRGDGLWKLAFERLRSRLDAEGLTAPARKRPLPRYPARVGIVTSASGAALRDIISVVRRRAPWTDITLCGCRVQGEGAAAEIARAIECFARTPCADVLIVGRGGGSIEDLWAFNEEIVARAITNSPIPTISAVGHETDFTIADLVADFRAPTPSAAAEAAVPDGRALRRELGELQVRLQADALGRLRSARTASAVLEDRLRLVARHLPRSRRDRLANAAATLQALSPLAALARGFAIPVNTERRVLRSVADFVPGLSFDLTLSDGSVPCRVEPVEPPDLESQP